MHSKLPTAPILITSLFLCSCGENNKNPASKEQKATPQEIAAAERKAELEHARKLAEIEFQKEKRLSELRAESKRKEQVKRAAEQKAFEQSAAGRRIRVVKKLYFRTRNSLMDETSTVLIIVNPSNTSADIKLQCQTGGNYQKTLSVSVPANGREEIGWAEGWAFKKGHSFKVYYNGKLYHSMVIK